MTTSSRFVKLNVFGLSLTIKDDMNAKEEPMVLKESQGTSGKPNISLKFQNPNVTGITITPTPQEDRLLRQWSAENREGILSYTKVDGTVKQNTGVINYQGTETADNVGTIDLMPNSGEDWT